MQGDKHRALNENFCSLSTLDVKIQVLSYNTISEPPPLVKMDQLRTPLWLVDQLKTALWLVISLATLYYVVWARQNKAATATAAAAAVSLIVQIDVLQSVVIHQRVRSFPLEFTIGWPSLG